MHLYVVTRSRPYHLAIWSANSLVLLFARVPVSPCQLAHSRKRVPTYPLEGFAFAYFPTVGAGISFALAAPMATIFSIIA